MVILWLMSLAYNKGGEGGEKSYPPHDGTEIEGKALAVIVVIISR